MSRNFRVSKRYITHFSFFQRGSIQIHLFQNFSNPSELPPPLLLLMVGRAWHQGVNVFLSPVISRAAPNNNNTWATCRETTNLRRWCHPISRRTNNRVFNWKDSSWPTSRIQQPLKTSWDSKRGRWVISGTILPKTLPGIPPQKNQSISIRQKKYWQNINRISKNCNFQGSLDGNEANLLILHGTDT